MSNYDFQPAQITVAPGTKVIWTNKSNTTHTSTSGSGCTSDGKWNSGNLDEGQSFSHTFDAEGTYNYFCTPHCSMGMTGVVTVKTGAVSTGTVAAGEEGQQTKRKKAPTPGFKSLDIINSPSTYVLNKGFMDLSIFHRFDDISGPNGGGQVLYGLDNMRDMRIALSYGLFKNVTIGVGRSKGDWFNAPYQEIKNLYDGSARIAIIRQDTCKRIPVSITIFGSTVYSAMDRQDVYGSEADFNFSTDRWSHSAQVMISRNFRSACDPAGNAGVCPSQLG
jgi:hypothetical protein